MNIDNQTKLYHIGFSREDIEYATLAILTDDSDYTKDLALALDSKARLVCINREYHSYIIHVNETPVLIVSTGFGGPAMGIGLEELSMLGLTSFIRLGETGAVREYLQVGDFVIAKGALRQEGTSQHYAPINYPASADFSFVEFAEQAMICSKLRYRIGVVASTDILWPKQTASDLFDKCSIDYQYKLLKSWRDYRILSADNTTATLLTIASVFNLQAISILDVIDRIDTPEYELSNIKRDDAIRIEKWCEFLPNLMESILEK
ncbi:uridine phosphorylase [Francisella adeliensis]|uniref:Uridine phosphorylase n=1 Tax=Francisella adeliensis TaxID=2007306 RepID=A0A2Z4Y1Q4_9GAMM|nr:uridine phosphorylase [Francisella adeliensis]AXA34623.1 hypothetical protein CDH04_09540 [Francisella adeliensis]MBK2086349.1 uridine phosphorylase [Francisella adeliensis]MBK2096564.1 uridine phosphorylase [Francisella adeliensis]QIW12867.1 nucleoside phosphorylase [Francisella adeliensis]QIW14744.1 nucleoside phosphorylase [Francisella adeliensis]